MFILSLFSYFIRFTFLSNLYKIPQEEGIMLQSCSHSTSLVILPILACSVNEKETTCLIFAKICFFLLAP